MKKSGKNLSEATIRLYQYHCNIFHRFLALLFSAYKVYSYFSSKLHIINQTHFYGITFMKIKNKSALIIAILIPIAVGTLSALFSGRTSLYSTINKPPLSPPGLIFPIVWFILYILMGISSYIIYESDSPEKIEALNTYALQLFFNFWWSIIFFRFSLFLFAFLWLLALIFLISVMIYQFYRINRLSSYLQIPYLLWCLFAAYLNFMIYRLN